MSSTTLDKVLASPRMPSLPTVAVKLLELTRDPNVDLGDIAELVQYDQALAAKILKTVNSSYYALSQPCPTIKRALAYLGQGTVKSLVLGFSLVELSRDCDDQFDLMDYWRRCVYSAAAARRIALVTGRCDPEEAFIAALMQDIGMLALHSVLGPQYGTVVAETTGNHLALPYVESDHLGFTHADAGARLGERWNLPGQIVDPIRQHHQRGTPVGDHRDIINAVILAYRISNIATWPNHKQVLDMISAMAQTMFHMSVEDERSVLMMVGDDVRELAELLDVHLGEQTDIQAILSQADDAVARRAQSAHAEADRRAAESLAEEAFSDALTGLGNRRRFDEELAARFADTLSRGTSLSVLLLDVDRLRSINDEHGQVAGDEVLDAVGRRIEENLGSRGVVCRYGGAAFAVMLPGVARPDAARIAEHLRTIVESEPIELDSGPAAITASVGVAAMDSQLASVIVRADQLVKLADRALYAAKRDGRNCVRVFNPRPSAEDAA